MFSRKDRLARVALLLAALLVAGPCQAIDLNRFDQRFEALLQEDGVPGGAYAIVRGDQVVQAAGHGVRTIGTASAVTPETVFRIASVSKPFAAHLTALLVDEGALSWDQPIREHVPEFTLADTAHAEALEIQHLLGQSAGIVPNAYDNLLNANQSLERILPQFARVESLCQPGRCYTYQNVLFALIQPAIEASTQTDYDELLAERIFNPLNMHDSSTGLAAFRAAENRAVAHVRVSRRLPWIPATTNENYYRVAPAAGINASARDLAQWLIAQLGHRPDVIADAQIEAVTEARVRTARELRRRAWRDLLSDAHYGLGWRIYQVGQDTLFLHSGWVRGFVAEVAYSRTRQLGLVVLLNAESRALNRITTTFWREALAQP
ncbi:MAG: serine hydrolase domain-containing protein [Pseudomonadota bacterium]